MVFTLRGEGQFGRGVGVWSCGALWSGGGGGVEGVDLGQDAVGCFVEEEVSGAGAGGGGGVGGGVLGQGPVELEAGVQDLFAAIVGEEIDGLVTVGASRL